MMDFRKTVPVVAAAFMMMGLGACGTSKKNSGIMESSPRVPGAQAVVKTSDAGNNNTALDIRVRHLAPVQKIAPDASTYVVWVQPTDGSPAQNVGALNVNDELEGQLKTVTPYKAMSVFITPEQMATASYPKGERILTTTIQQ